MFPVREACARVVDDRLDARGLAERRDRRLDSRQEARRVGVPGIERQRLFDVSQRQRQLVWAIAGGLNALRRAGDEVRDLALEPFGGFRGRLPLRWPPAIDPQPGRRRGAVASAPSWRP